MRTQVAIIGAGPAGTLLSLLLHGAGIESIVVEARSKEYVLGRIRAGVLEQGSVDILRRAGVGDRVSEEGLVHEGVNLAFTDRMLRIDFKELVGRTVTVYGQTEVQKDLYAAAERLGCQIIFEADEVAVHEVDTNHAFVTFGFRAQEERIDCEFIVGCDGSHGVSRSAILNRQTFERNYSLGWLGILSETPPVADELIYAHHQRGFALCSMRNQNLSRYYLQCSIDDSIDDWPDDRFWEELSRRLPNEVSACLVTGPSIEKSTTPLRSVIHEPMNHGRLFLCGDAAHVVPPTGAKGLNLAIADVAYLASIIARFHENGDLGSLVRYSETALARVWKAVRFSWWLTNLMHTLETERAISNRLKLAYLEFLAGSRGAQAAFAENYTGLPL